MRATLGMVTLAAGMSSSSKYKNLVDYDSYYFEQSEDKQNWLTAQQNCRTLGGTLAAIHDVQDNDRAYAMCKDERCWIGFNDRFAEGDWEWSDGSSNKFSGYHHWAPHEPDNTSWQNSRGSGDEDCGYMHGSGYDKDQSKRKMWGDHPCREKMSYICKIPLKHIQLEGKHTWTEAEQVCQSRNGHLAHVHSAADEQNVLEICKSGRCWIGLNDRDVESVFRWTDGTGSTSYTHWADGEPNNALYKPSEYGGELDEDCGYMHGMQYPDTGKRGKWGDHPCEQRLSAVCQVPADYTLHVSKGGADFTSASNSCRADGGMLATVHSLAENRRVARACQTTRCWLGLNDEQREGDFRWSDGSSLQPTAFCNWVPGEPDNTKYASGIDEDCVYMHGTEYPTQSKIGQWGDHPCTEKMLYVCQLPVTRRSSSSSSGFRTAAAASGSHRSSPQFLAASSTPRVFATWLGNMFWLLVYAALAVFVLRTAMQRGFIQERQIYATRRQLQDKVVALLKKAGVMNSQEDTGYKLMSHEEEPDILLGIPQTTPAVSARSSFEAPDSDSGGYEAPAVPGVYCA